MLGSDYEDSRHRWGKSSVATRKWKRHLGMEGSLVQNFKTNQHLVTLCRPDAAKLFDYYDDEEEAEDEQYLCFSDEQQPSEVKGDNLTYHCLYSKSEQWDLAFWDHLGLASV
ncbi:hypothetical protein CMV_001291 [Castanea mollissima]|uniref:Uncharacterized protein n=1 Tax=Castanea mollissima TaxID=60419 RepID=A0A8J4W6J9_9ROSI|nr:hypothetical protein CMV_001291 [Castanea mollissima]